MIKHKKHSLKRHNTFHLPYKADNFIIIENDVEYLDALDHLHADKGKHLVIGGGSNILFTSDFQGTIIKTSISELQVLDQNTEFTWLWVSAGYDWHSLVLKTIEMGLYGLENLSLIPGTMGAAPVQNIGAYGVELDQYIDSVEAYDIESGELIRFMNKDCQFSYRSSIFKHELKNKMLIKAVVLRLYNKPHFNVSYGDIKSMLNKMSISKLTATDISNVIIRIRSEKLPDPEKIGNAGSFFKNPEIDHSDYKRLHALFPGLPYYKMGERYKIPAAWLIEKSGWKGKRIKNTGTYPNQPLVLVNYGHASGQEILDLSLAIQKSVKELFDIDLIPEVNIL